MHNTLISIEQLYHGNLSALCRINYYEFIAPFSGSFELICTCSAPINGAIYREDLIEYMNSAYAKNKTVVRLASTLLRGEKYWIEFQITNDVEYESAYTFSINHITTPKASHFKYQWGLLNRANGVDINILPVWKYVYDSNIYIGIADTGINFNHRNLNKNLNSTLSYNFVHDDDDIYPEFEGEDVFAARNGHGTHVAGIIAAYPDHERGILGIINTPNTIALKVLGNTRDDTKVFNKTSDAFILAIEYAQKHGIRIINCSFSGRDFFEKEKLAIEDARDILFIMAAGNKGLNIDEEFVYPACYHTENSIIVAAIDKNGQIVDQTNYGYLADIAAPGDNVASLYENDQFKKAQGTSVAVPFVTGVCALILERNPSLSPAEVKQILTHPDNVTYKADLKGKVQCSGIVNAYKAIITDASGLLYSS